jgi:aspartate/methionine/tyrosine aminotransferase
LKIIGELADKYDVVVIEDLAYFAMDFRLDLSKPGVPPYQPTVARYTRNWVMMISSSKVFSYAGQRIGVLIISDLLYHRHSQNLSDRLRVHGFGNAIVHRVLYAMTSGTSHSAQFALAAMFRHANNGDYNFIGEVKEYGEKAKIMKQLFLANGFEIVYATDIDKPVGDGFYFTITYPGMDEGKLLYHLLFYGISAISLGNTGSSKQGLRACVSNVRRDQFEDLERRLNQFRQDFPADLQNES